MFGTEIFESWPAVFTGAGFFGGLYGMIIVMSDRLMFDIDGISFAAVGITCFSFVGYVGVALLIRRKPPE